MPPFGYTAVLFFLNVPVALATTFMPLPFPERIEEADAIVRATVGNSHTEWSTGRDGSKRIYTFTEVTPREVIKESASQPLPSQSFMVRELGGMKDGVGMQVSGTAHLTRGEDVVLMLGRANSDGSYDIRGMMMGKYNLERDSQGEEVLIGPGLDGSDDPEGHAFHEGHGKTQGQSGTSGAEKWTLRRMKEWVRKANAPRQTISPSPLAAQPQAPEAGASSLHSDSGALDPERPSSGMDQVVGGSGGQAWLWGLGLSGVLGILAIWGLRRVLKARR